MDNETICGFWFQGGNMEIGAHMHLPSLGRGGTIWWEVDTGADKTLLCPRDSSNLGIDYAALPFPEHLNTIGGRVLAHRIPGILYLTGERHVYGFSTTIFVLNPSTSTLTKSLLGLEFLRKVNLVTMATESQFLVIPSAPDSCLEWNTEEAAGA